MRIHVAKDPFVQALARTNTVVERRSTREILEYLLLEADEGGLWLSATDLRVSLRHRVGAQVDEGGQAAFRARMLFEIVRELPGDTVTVTMEEDQWATISAGRSVFRLPAVDASSYPSLPVPPDAFSSAPVDVFREMLEKTLYAASNDESRIFLCGVYVKALLNPDGSPVLRMVATDGHRLSLVERPVESPLPVFDEGVILPKKGLSGLKAFLDDAEETFQIAHDDGKVFARFDGCDLALTLVEGTFPQYEEVIPSEASHTVVVERGAFSDALRRVSVLSDPQTHSVIMEVGPDGVELRSMNSQHGDARESLEAQVEGGPVRIAFNAAYLVDAVRHVEGDTVRIDVSDPVLPCVVRSERDPGYLAVIMPIRID